MTFAFSTTVFLAQGAKCNSGTPSPPLVERALLPLDSLKTSFDVVGCAVRGGAEPLGKQVTNVRAESRPPAGGAVEDLPLSCGGCLVECPLGAKARGDCAVPGIRCRILSLCYPRVGGACAMWEPCRCLGGLGTHSVSVHGGTLRGKRGPPRCVGDCGLQCNSTKLRGHRRGRKLGRTGSILYLVQETGCEGGFAEPSGGVLGSSGRCVCGGEEGGGGEEVRRVGGRVLI